jgi:bifunctional DNA-binding transcriptional regulator/antitoxin component of YhaV-PrlF toxin-antitoxin module
VARSETWLDARFRSAIPKDVRNRTGLVETDDYCHICVVCDQHYANKNPEPPSMCTGHIRDLEGRPCISVEFYSYRNIEVEAMPIGRVIIDHRKRGERGW